MKEQTMLIAILILTLAKSISSFMPAQIIDELIQDIDSSNSHIDLGKVSDSLSHDELLRRGLIRSVAQYYYDQKNGSTKINLNNMDRYFKDIGLIYTDYYGSIGRARDLKLIYNLKTDLMPQVAIVDFAPDTKDLPYAHFDAERLSGSNDRVINFTSRIYTAISKSDYKTARKLTGQILHTIQDFYSHSNWVEMGKSEINSAIGTNNFKSQSATTTSDTNECVSNCTKVSIECSAVVTKIVNTLKTLKSDIKASCPITYYKCSGNIVQLDKMLTGYYTDSKLDDGTLVNNPGNMNKCNHGGFADNNSYSKDAIGGVNKDTGMYLISPHANLHVSAAKFAELHSAYFFNSIRSKIGDTQFQKFLDI